MRFNKEIKGLPLCFITRLYQHLISIILNIFRGRLPPHNRFSMRLAKIKVIIILRICFKKAVHVQGNFPFCYDQSIKTSKIKTLTAREIDFFCVFRDSVIGDCSSSSVKNLGICITGHFPVLVLAYCIT